MGQLKRILVSLPDTLLEEVNEFVSTNGLSRSELIREAMQEYIKHRKQMEIKERLKEGYKLMAAINLEWAEMCFEADCEEQFNYEEKLAECE